MNYNGNATFTWQGNDGTINSSNTATTTIVITPVNDAPVVSSFVKNGTEDTTLTFATTDFTTNFSDVENQTLASVRVLSLPTNGTLRLNTTAVTVNQVIPAASLSTLNFVPNANRNGSVSFSREATDGSLYAVVSASVQINIASVNDAPSISDTVDQVTNEDTQKSAGFTI